MTLGAISANTISRKATLAVAIVITLSSWPKLRMAIAVTSAVAMALIRVLAIRTSDSSLSVRSSSHRVVTAPRWPRLARWRRRYLFAAIRAVSAIAKKAEQRIRRTRARTSAQRGTVSKVDREEAAGKADSKGMGWGLQVWLVLTL